jgi:CRP-like cAMP-binding protein
LTCLNPNSSRCTYLAEIDIYRDLDQDEIDRINEHAPMKTYRRGEMLFTPDQPVETLFMLKTGQVRVFSHEQLAALVGTSRETTKVLGEMADAGAVKLGRGRITVVSPLRLEEAAATAGR